MWYTISCNSPYAVYRWLSFLWQLRYANIRYFNINIFRMKEVWTSNNNCRIVTIYRSNLNLQSKQIAIGRTNPKFWKFLLWKTLYEKTNKQTPCLNLNPTFKTEIVFTLYFIVFNLPQAVNSHKSSNLGLVLLCFRKIVNFFIYFLQNAYWKTNDHAIY